MLVTYIRSSSYNNYAYCEMQYFITYVLGHQSNSGKKADMGTMAHKVMEVLAGLKKYHQDHPRAKYLKVDDDAVGEVKIDKAELHTDDLVETLTNLSIDSYGKNSTHRFTAGDRRDILATVNTFLKHQNGQFDPRLRNIHYPEPHFDIPIEEDWAKFEYEVDGKKMQGQLAIKGTIDLVTKLDDETIEVVDWKGLPLDTKLPTPNGWTTMGEIQVGDTVFDQYGEVWSGYPLLSMRTYAPSSVTVTLSGLKSAKAAGSSVSGSRVVRSSGLHPTLP